MLLDCRMCAQGFGQLLVRSLCDWFRCREQGASVILRFTAEEEARDVAA
jgi:hypothetical protein